jgi:tRNA (guanosine-2'-O-)-methyltransferase
MLTQDRETKIQRLVKNRQHDLVVILENVHDPHNLGAIVRTCDAAGVIEIHVIYSEDGPNSLIQYVGKRASRGAAKWIKVLFHANAEECLKIVRQKVDRVYATHLNEESNSIYQLDLSLPTAIVFGNEKDGISAQLLSLCDGNIKIPMFGMVQSLNVSNAAAIILFETVRQRIVKGMYDKDIELSEVQYQDSMVHYISKSKPRVADANLDMIKHFVAKTPKIKE